MKLKGAYKGTRKRKAPPQIILIECPGCGWKGKPNEITEAEAEYVIHLDNYHIGPLECAFCGDTITRGIRLLPDFATLAVHVKHFHPDIVRQHENQLGEPLPQGALVPHSFK